MLSDLGHIYQILTCTQVYQEKLYILMALSALRPPLSLTHTIIHSSHRYLSMYLFLFFMFAQTYQAIVDYIMFYAQMSL